MIILYISFTIELNCALHVHQKDPINVYFFRAYLGMALIFTAFKHIFQTV